MEFIRNNLQLADNSWEWSLTSDSHEWFHHLSKASETSLEPTDIAKISISVDIFVTIEVFGQQTISMKDTSNTFSAAVDFLPLLPQRTS